jgi:hypothetical protein
MTMVNLKRRWVQFSLRTGFVIVTLLRIALSMWVVPAERQRRAAKAIEAMGGWLDYVPFLALVEGSGVSDPRESEAFPLTFLRRWLPPDYFDEVLQVHFRNARLTEVGLAHLQRLTSMQTLTLDNTEGTDALLAQVQGQTGLQQLFLGGGQITDAGLAHVQGLTGLQDLSLGGTQVTDPGLAYLEGLTSLQELSLANTQVSDAGLAHLQGLTSLQGLRLDNTKVTDAGLAHLQGLTGLRWLDLSKTQVTESGVAKLRQALPKCKVNGP